MVLFAKIHLWSVKIHLIVAKIRLNTTDLLSNTGFFLLNTAFLLIKTAFFFLLYSISHNKDDIFSLRYRIPWSRLRFLSKTFYFLSKSFHNKLQRCKKILKKLMSVGCFFVLLPQWQNCHFGIWDGNRYDVIMAYNGGSNDIGVVIPLFYMVYDKNSLLA